jgi:hypothetical protein
MMLAMTVNEHLSTFHGLPVATFEVDQPVEPVAWRLTTTRSMTATESFAALWQRFLAKVDTESVTALVIGEWGDVYNSGDADSAIALMVATKDKLPALTGIFLGDIVVEQCEISWIKQGDVTPLLTGFPALTQLAIRGSDGLRLQPVQHAALRTLWFETGGLPVSVLRAVAESELPVLRELRLWLGVEDYGADWQLSDLAPFVDGKRFSALRYLGLQDSEEQNDIARLVATSAVLSQLETLDLSLGTLTDEGASALLEADLTHLKTLDLHHHFLSDEMMRRLRDALEPAGVQLDLSEVEEPDEYEDEIYYYTAVAE